MKSKAVILIPMFALLLLLFSLSFVWPAGAEAESVPLSDEEQVPVEEKQEEEQIESNVPGLYRDPQNEKVLCYYSDYAAGKIDTSFNGFAQLSQEEDETWYFVRNGTVDPSYNNVVQGTVSGESGWFLVRGGQWKKENTVAKNENGWWAIIDGKVDFSCDSVCQNENGWWAITNGGVDFNFHGFKRNENGWWYLRNGKVGFDVNDLLYGWAGAYPDQSGTNGWWYVRGSKVTPVETVAHNAYGWWYVRDGKVDFSCNSVKKNENGWWAITNGGVDFNFHGFKRNENGWWYLRNGKVGFDVNGLLYGRAGAYPDQSGTNGWWYVRGSKVTPVETVAHNAYGWWYVRDGKVDFSCNSVKQNENGWWVIRNGAVDFGYNGLAQNENGWWVIRNGKVDFGYNGLVQNGSVWWMIRNGQVDFTYTGPAVISGKAFHLVDGHIDWSYSGTVVGSSNYQVSNGVVVSGWISYNGAAYYCLNSGRVATETVSVDGRQEVFRMDGRWIDTGSMDAAAANYYSNTNYLILVNLAARVTKVYKWNGKGWSVAKSFLCTVGNSSRGWDTIRGDHYIGKSSWGNPAWKGYSFEDAEGHTLYYWTRFCDSFLFHSQLYDRNTYHLSAADNALGEALSHGCVRLRFENAKWINENIPYGTRVIVY